jgi:O-antigen/teichoic acid export membrane protein
LSNIRVTYSGLISFVVGLISVITGLIFTLIVTRQLSQEEFGTWSLIGSLITYVIFVEPVISYWSLREIARGKNSGTTAIFSSGLFSVGAIIVYIIIAFIVGNQIGADTTILIFAAILIPVLFLNKTLNAINNAWKPEVTSYGLIIFELTKIPVGLVLVYFLQMGLYGAIIATVLAYSVSNIVLALYARNKIRGKFQISVIKEWLKKSWLTIFPSISSLILNLDVAIFAIITKSVEGVALFAVATTITGLIAHTNVISNAIYPKMLGGGKTQHVQDNMIKFLYFAIPLTALTIVFAKPTLFALNPIYEIAQWIVFFMALKVFLVLFMGIFTRPVMGLDIVDATTKSTFKDYLKSTLFKIPSIRFIHNIIYLSIFTGIIFIAFSYEKSQLELVMYWTIVSLITTIPLTIYFYKLSRKVVEINFDFSIIKYILTSIVVFSFMYILMEEFLIYNESIFIFLPDLVFYVLIASGLYLSITYCIDKKTKELFVSIYNELIKK